MPLFEVSPDGLIPFRQLESGAGGYDEVIEDVLWRNLDALVGERLFRVRRQAPLDGGGRPAVIALDANGAVVVIHVRRQMDRSGLAECLEYAGWARAATLDELAMLYWRGDSDFWTDWHSFVGGTSRQVKPAPRIMLATGDFTARAQSTFEFLVENGLPVKVMKAAMYQEPGGRRIIDVDAPSDVESVLKPSPAAEATFERLSRSARRSAERSAERMPEIAPPSVDATQILGQAPLRPPSIEGRVIDPHLAQDPEPSIGRASGRELLRSPEQPPAEPSGRAASRAAGRSADIGHARPANLDPPRPADFGQTRSADLGQTRPADLGQTRSADRGQTRPADLGQTRSADFGQVRPDELGQPRQAEPRNVDSRNAEPRNAEPRGLDPRNAEPRGLDPRNAEPRGLDPRNAEPRGLDPRNAEPRGLDPRNAEPRNAEPRGMEHGRRALERAPERPAERPIDRQAERPIDRQAERPLDRPVEPTDRPVERSLEMPMRRSNPDPLQDPLSGGLLPPPTPLTAEQLRTDPLGMDQIVAGQLADADKPADPLGRTDQHQLLPPAPPTDEPQFHRQNGRGNQPTQPLNPGQQGMTPPAPPSGFGRTPADPFEPPQPEQPPRRGGQFPPLSVVPPMPDPSGDADQQLPDPPQADVPEPGDDRPERTRLSDIMDPRMLRVPDGFAWGDPRSTNGKRENGHRDGNNH